MYTVWEHKKAAKIIAGLPPGIQRNYQAWKRIVELEGSQGLRMVKGFHDEALKGQWDGCRSSRLSGHWRVIYAVKKDELVVYVIEINHHEY